MTEAPRVLEAPVAASTSVSGPRWADPLLRNAALGLVLTVLMAGAGAAFWVIAARLRPAADVGLAGSLVTAGEALAVLSLLGYNVALVRTMPASDRPAADVRAAVVAVVSVAAVLAIVYALLLPVTSPRLGAVVTTAVVPIFAIWVAATALNQLSDAIFLAVDRVAANVWVNGLAMGPVKCALPVLFAGGGALGLYGAVGTASLLAGTLSIWAIVRRLPPGVWHRSSQNLRDARRFAQAGYLSETLYLVPQLVFPLILLNALGATVTSRYFVAFQVATLLNALVYVVGHSMYASASRTPDEAARAARRGGLLILGATTVGGAALVALAPYLLHVFGAAYADEGTTTLRLLAAGSLGVGLNYWAAMRLRIGSHLRAMVGVQLTTTAVMVAAAVLVAPHGIEYVALAWGLGQLLGGAGGVLALAVVEPMAPHRAAS